MKKAIKYSVVVCLASWIFAGIMIFGLGIKNVADEPMKYTLCASLYMLFPMICAMALQIMMSVKTHVRVSLRETGLLRFKIKGSWFVAWFLPVVIVMLTILVNSLFPNVTFNTELSEMISTDQVSAEQMESLSLLMNPSVFIVITLISGLFAGITINALFAFGEEYGWRNYLVDALREKKFVVASIFIGIVWGIWHFPLILLGHNYPQHSVAGVFMMVIFCVLLSFVETYFVVKAKSVYPAAIFHGTINAIAGLNLIMIKGGNDLSNGITGLSGFIVILIIILLIFCYDRFVSKDDIFCKTIGEVLGDGER